MTTAERRLALAGALVLYMAFIAYQSLAGGAPKGCGPLLAHEGASISRSDGLANLVAYIPPGLLVAAWIGGGRRFAPRAIGWLAICIFSLVMEVLQACLTARVSSWYDWSTNSLGALAGMAVLPLLERVFARVGGRLAGSRSMPMARPTLLFLGAWLALSTAPWRFTLDVGTIRSNLSFLRRVAGASVDPWLFAQHACAWIAVGVALRALARSPAAATRALLALLAVSLGSQVLLVHRALSWSELAGAAAAFLACRLVAPRVADARLARLLPAFAVAAVAAYEFAPRAGAWVRMPFSWWPLLGRGSLVGALQLALFFSWLAFAIVLSMRWAAHEAGDGALPRAVHARGRHFMLPSCAVLALLVAEYAQTWMPGRTGDTSPALVTALAFVIAWVLTERIRDRARPRSSRSGD